MFSASIRFTAQEAFGALAEIDVRLLNDNLLKSLSRPATLWTKFVDKSVKRLDKSDNVLCHPSVNSTENKGFGDLTPVARKVQNRSSSLDPVGDKENMIDQQNRQFVGRGRVFESFDSEYVQRLIDGDSETERHFAAYFGELLLIKLRARLRSAQAIEDLRQETFLRVLTALRQKQTLRSPERLGAYVNSVCNNLLFELYRSQSRTQCSDIEEFEPADEHMSAEAALVTEERQQHVRQVLDELPEKDRKLLRLVFYDDVDKAEICRMLDSNRGNLRVMVHRAKARFRERLMKRQPEMCRHEISGALAPRCQLDFA
jgi:RNA polymerase sigma-70 factor (ECF subfamily)